jgi:hypothetical protein
VHTMVFAIVLQWRKAVFWGLRLFAFSLSSFLAIVQANVRIIRDCTARKSVFECCSVGLVENLNWLLQLCEEHSYAVRGARTQSSVRFFYLFNSSSV